LSEASNWRDSLEPKPDVDKYLAAEIINEILDHAGFEKLKNEQVLRYGKSGFSLCVEEWLFDLDYSF
jgi:hypothetical protein